MRSCSSNLAQPWRVTMTSTKIRIVPYLKRHQGCGCGDTWTWMIFFEYTSTQTRQPFFWNMKGFRLDFASNRNDCWLWNCLIDIQNIEKEKKTTLIDYLYSISVIFVWNLLYILMTPKRIVLICSHYENIGVINECDENFSLCQSRVRSMNVI